MGIFFRIWSVLTNPIFVPLYASLLFYGLVGYMAYDFGSMVRIIFVIIALTMIIPLVIYVLLKRFGIVGSIHLRKVRERRTPLLAYCVLILILLRMGSPEVGFSELYYFFVGVVIAAFTAFILCLLRYKISLHMIGMGGLTTFITLLMLSYGMNLNAWLIAAILVSGVTGTARLYETAHSGHELVFGYCLGIGSQLVLTAQYL